MEDKKVLQTKLVVEYEQLITKIEDLEGDLGYVSGNNLDDLNLLIEYKDRLENEINSFPGQKTPKKIIAHISNCIMNLCGLCLAI